MQESTAAADLFQPGKAGNFFDLDPLPAFEPGVFASFHRANALWLAEFSRLIYRQEAVETPNLPVSTTRRQILNERAQGWDEEPGDFLHGTRTKAAFFVNRKLGCACLVFRGTLGFGDMFTDSLIVARGWQGAGSVHSGFKAALDEVWEPLAARLRSLAGPVFFTGHSLGGALATLAAARVRLDPTLRPPSAIYTFGSPRVGDATFGASLAGFPHYRLVNDQDLVTTVPPAFSLPLFPTYQHCGHLHQLTAGGTIKIHPQETEATDVRTSRAALTDFLSHTARLITQAAQGLGRIPPSLLDHSPINYVARIEQVRMAN